jgi:hypothetical protein
MQSSWHSVSHKKKGTLLPEKGHLAKLGGAWPPCSYAPEYHNYSHLALGNKYWNSPQIELSTTNKVISLRDFPCSITQESLIMVIISIIFSNIWKRLRETSIKIL